MNRMPELAPPERILKKLGIAILCIVLVIYVARQLISLVNSNIETETALAVTREQAIELEGYIMRNESILNGRDSGVMLASCSDGSRVSNGKEAVRVYYTESDLSVENDIRDLDKQIDILQRSSMDTAYVSADMDKMDDEIEELISGSLIYSAKNDLVGALSNRDELLIRMNKRWLITNPGKVFEEKITELKNRRSTLKNGLSGNSASITTNQSGYYYASVDGYENVFSAEKIPTLTVDEFARMTDSAPEAYSVRPAGKIVTDYKWYVACSVTPEQARLFDIGNSYSVEFTYNYGTVLDMVLHSKIVENNKDSAVLIFESGEMPSDFEFTRNQKVKVIYNKYSGLKVPKDAVRVINDVKGVYVVSGTEIEFKRVEEIYSMDDYYIIEQDPESEKYAKKYVRKTTITEDGKEKNTYFRSLSLYDQVVVKGRDLYDGMKVE